MFTAEDWESININAPDNEKYAERGWYDDAKNKISDASGKINNAATDAYSSASNAASDVYTSATGTITDTYNYTVAQYEEIKEKIDKITKFIKILPWILFFSFLFFIIVVALIIFFMVRHHREKTRRQRKQIDDLTNAINTLILKIDPNAKIVDEDSDEVEDVDVVDVNVDKLPPKDSTSTLASPHYF